MGHLTLKDAVFLTITSIVGGGIFVLSPLTYLLFGKSVIWGWILLIFVSLIMASPFAYATTKISESGGIYKFVMNILGKKIGAFSAYILWLSGVFALSGVVSFFEIVFNTNFNVHHVGFYLIIVLTLLILAGIKIVGNFVRIFGVLTISIILYIVFQNGIDLTYIGSFNLKTAILTVYFGLWTSTGWEGITMPLSAFKDQKTIAYGLLIGTLIIGILYLLFTLTVISLNVNTDNINEILKILIGHNFFLLVGMLTIISSCAFSVLFTLSYMPYGMGKDRIFPNIFTKIKKGIPTRGVLLNSLLVMLLLIFNAKTLVDMSMFLTLIAYFLLYLSVFKEASGKIKTISLISMLISGSLVAFRVYSYIISH
ncbi:amino acid permease-associated region [Methanocaldococcus vulcanius M7]|uniref:Amino acid permease-associated region n=1 Tax=Methanocaldococcus vulcanius (strain ATCC 700851 / DSM 12094 / M7) TaxID=579137 RepID=C9RDL6_METVM|nr:APC family permease [Methanocaldococcus vulcanius]ACX73395.1 amino acid permease-associated region [Methanocaldococcus vulcanius M7]